MNEDVSINQNLSSVKIIHLVRSIEVSSMIWNELYFHSRLRIFGVLYPPVVVHFFGRTEINDTPHVKDGFKKYFSTSFFRVLCLLSKLVRRRRYDEQMIIHVHNLVLAPIAVLTKWVNSRVSIVANLHSDWKYMRFHQKLCLYLLAYTSSYFITVSTAIQENIPKNVKDSLEKRNALIAIPNGIPTINVLNGIKSRADDQLPVVKREGAIVVARMVPAKNCLFIFDLLKQSNVIERLEWYGDGPMRKEIEKKIIDEGLEQKVLLRGTQPRSVVYKAMMRSSLYISASNWEGLGVANLEAIAFGSYPLMSNIPAHNEIAKKICHFTLDTDKPDEWIKAIHDFCALNDEQKMKLRQKFSNTVKRYYDIDSMIHSYINVYQRIANNKL